MPPYVCSCYQARVALILVKPRNLRFMWSPVSEGTQDSKGARVADHLQLSMKVRRVPNPLDFKQSLLLNTIPACLFKTLANGAVTMAMAIMQAPRRMKNARTCHLVLGL